MPLPSLLPHRPTRPSGLTPLFVKVGKQAIPLHAIARVDGERLERLEVDLHLLNGEVITAHGIDAVELMMQVKPVMVEGHRLRYGRLDWLVHNLVGHPAMQLLALLKLYRWAFWVHDVTVPTPRGIHPRTAATVATEREALNREPREQGSAVTDDAGEPSPPG